MKTCIYELMSGMNLGSPSIKAKRYSCIFVLLFLVFFNACDTPKKEQASNDTSFEAKNSPLEPSKEQLSEKSGSYKTVEIQDPTKKYLTPYYSLDEIRYFYFYDNEVSYTPPREINFNASLKDLEYEALHLLKQELYARNGHLFEDGAARGYFNQFEWYRPIFDVDSFEVQLNQKEQVLLTKINKELGHRKKDSILYTGKLKMHNADLIINKSQFNSVDESILDDLSEQNFSIIEAKRALPFYVYDENAYNHIPHYITTDLYLYLLHQFFSKFMEGLDQNYNSKTLTQILANTKNETILQKANYTGQHKDTYDWLESYLALSLYAGKQPVSGVPSTFGGEFRVEQSKIDAKAGNPAFVNNPGVSYAELKPRGYYTNSDTLRNYFTMFKWLSLNGVEIDNKENLKGMVLLSYIVQSTPKIYQEYTAYLNVIERIAGNEDNISLKDLNALVDISQGVETLLSEQQIEKIQKELSSIKKEQVFSFLKGENTKNKRLYFFSSTASISGAVFSNLVDPSPVNSARPFPKAIDLAAVFKDPTAINILETEFYEQKKWPSYTDRLSEQQAFYSNYNLWETSYSNRSFKTALSSMAETSEYPDFMKTNAYNRKEINTFLASWTHLKHDLILYQEKPNAAEGGQGGGPEPPTHFSYVEPNKAFWNNAVALSEYFKTFSEYDNSLAYQLEEIIEIGKILKSTANKQLEGTPVSNREFMDLHWIGARIEHLILSILNVYELPENKRSMALIADTYSYKGTSLMQAVGHADDIFVVVPFNGQLYIARGMTFSFYEFTSESILRDEDWKKKVQKEELPERPSWYEPVVRFVPIPKGTAVFRYPGYHGYF